MHKLCQKKHVNIHVRACQIGGEFPDAPRVPAIAQRDTTGGNFILPAESLSVREFAMQAELRVQADS